MITNNLKDRTNQIIFECHNRVLNTEEKGILFLRQQTLNSCIELAKNEIGWADTALKNNQVNIEDTAIDNPSQDERTSE